MPKEIVTGGPLIRISMGARAHRQARTLADLLAAQARIIFNRARRKRVNKNPTEADPEDSEQLFTGETPEEVVAEMRGALKAYLRMIDRPEDAPSFDELQNTSGIRDLVNLSREIEAQTVGQPFNELIVGNADLLKQKALEKLQGSVAHNVPAIAQPSPGTPAASVLFPHEPTYPQEPILDEHGKPIPAFLLDRKTVFRKPSNLPRLSEVAAEYLEKRKLTSGKKNRDVKTARFRIDTFLELIGDQP